MKCDNISGKIAKDISELIANYIGAAIDNKLSATQKLIHFHHLFVENARRLYRTNVQLTALPSIKRVLKHIRSPTVLHGRTELEIIVQTII